MISRHVPVARIKNERAQQCAQSITLALGTVSVRGGIDNALRLGLSSVDHLDVRVHRFLSFTVINF